MADNPITVSLPADLPVDWAENQVVAPEGVDVGLSDQHGYNYLMQQVNAAQQAASQIGQAFPGLATLDENGKLVQDIDCGRVGHGPGGGAQRHGHRPRQSAGRWEQRGSR